MDEMEMEAPNPDPQDHPDPQATEGEGAPRERPQGFIQKYVMPNDIMEWFILCFMLVVGGGLFVLMIIAFSGGSGSELMK